MTDAKIGVRINGKLVAVWMNKGVEQLNHICIIKIKATMLVRLDQGLEEARGCGGGQGLNADGRTNSGVYTVNGRDKMGIIVCNLISNPLIVGINLKKCRGTG